MAGASPILQFQKPIKPIERIKPIEQLQILRE
jgi:hypothetical protein